MTNNISFSLSSLWVICQYIDKEEYCVNDIRDRFTHVQMDENKLTSMVVTF